MKKRSIVLVCGGSGGHINPAISLYEELIINDPDLVINFFSCLLYTSDAADE